MSDHDRVDLDQVARRILPAHIEDIRMLVTDILRTSATPRSG